LQVDTHPQRPHLAHRLQHDALDSNLMKCQGCGQPTDAAAGDDYGIIPHGGESAVHQLVEQRAQLQALPGAQPPGRVLFVLGDPLAQLGKHLFSGCRQVK